MLISLSRGIHKTRPPRAWTGLNFCMVSYKSQACGANPADYCVQSGFPAPTYKRIDQRDGYSHEIVLQSRSYRGFLNSYLNESDSMNACAHRGMYMSLVNGNGFTDGDSGPSGLSRADPSMLALVPRKLGKSDSCAIVSKPGVKREADDSDTAMPDCDGQRKRRRGRGGRGGRGATAEPPKAQVQKKPVVYSSKGGATAEPPKTQNPPKMLNANFLPLANSRLPSVATPKQKEEKRWAFSAREINSQLQRLMSHNARLESKSAVSTLDSLLTTAIHRNMPSPIPRTPRNPSRGHQRRVHRRSVLPTRPLPHPRRSNRTSEEYQKRPDGQGVVRSPSDPIYTGHGERGHDSGERDGAEGRTD